MGCFVNFWVIFGYIWEEIVFLEGLVKLREIRNIEDLVSERRSKDLEKHLTIKNCDKTFRKNIIKRLKNTTFRCTLHHYQVKLEMQVCGYKYKNGQ